MENECTKWIQCDIMKVNLQLRTRRQGDYIIVDEFAREARYYEYLDGISTIQRNITFMTKAEDKNLAVACGSIISRYLFLKEFDKICDEIHIPLPKGAGKDVDTIGKEVVDLYIKYLACGIANMVNIFQPEILCIGGGVSGEGQSLIDALMPEVRAQRYGGDLFGGTELRIAELKNDAGIIGAAVLG